MGVNIRKNLGLQCRLRINNVLEFSKGVEYVTCVFTGHTYAGFGAIQAILQASCIDGAGYHGVKVG